MKKFLKRTGLVLIFIFIIWTITALFVKSEHHIERSIAIKAPANVIFDQINSFKNWKSWSYWDNIDTKTMKDSFAGPEAGVGAAHFWDSPNDSVGKGTLTIIKSEPNKFIETELYFDGMGSSFGGWKLDDSAGIVIVTTYMDMQSPFFMRPMMLFMDMDKILGGDFEKSLNGLKKVTENIANSAPVSDLRIEITTVETMKIMSILDSCTTAEIGQKLGALYGEIGAELKKQKLEQAGPPFAVYHKVFNNPDGTMKFVLQAGIPIAKEAKTGGRVKYWEVVGTKAVKAWHYGSYESTAETHEIMQNWMAKNGNIIDGPPWEVYVTDPIAEPDQAKWLTEVYYPIK